MPGLLDGIVTPDALETNLKFVEHKIGSPAYITRVDEFGIERNFYKLRECLIQVGAVNGRVVSIGTNTLNTPGCDLDVSYIAGLKPSGTVGRSGRLMASRTKYGDYQDRGPLHFTDALIPGCNRCADGVLPFALIHGYTAGGFFDVQLKADFDGDSNDAAEKWRALIRGNLDVDKLPVTSFRGEGCPLGAFDEQGLEFMKNLRVSGIAFGVPQGALEFSAGRVLRWTASALQPECSGETVHANYFRN